MSDMDPECVVCHAPLVYLKETELMECCICHGVFPSSARCANGHYVCDSCHSRRGVSTAKEVCMSTDSRDPVEVLRMLMAMPGVHMHGPEHHVLVGSALITAYANSGGKVDLGKALDEMSRRGSQLPGGVCGLWGSCGAAVSCGMAYSIITGSSPLSGETWAECNLMTSRCLEAISRHGGPRCCKRDGYSALLAASEFIRERLGVGLEVPDGIVCIHFRSNPQCLGGRCPYHPVGQS